MPQQPAADAGHRDVAGSTPVPAVAAIDDATGFPFPVASPPRTRTRMVCQHCEFATSTATWPRSLISRASDQTERFSRVPTTFVAWRSPALPTSPENAIRQLLVVVRCRVAGGGCTSGHPDMTTK